MTLWNKETEGNPKPNWLSDDEKARCYCDDRGWVLVNLDGSEEVLVAGSGLNNPAEKGTSPDPDKISVGDLDGDGTRDYLDTDIDGDGVDNDADPEPLNPDVSE